RSHPAVTVRARLDWAVLLQAVLLPEPTPGAVDRIHDGRRVVRSVVRSGPTGPPASPRSESRNGRMCRCRPPLSGDPAGAVQAAVESGCQRARIFPSVSLK